MTASPGRPWTRPPTVIAIPTLGSTPPAYNSSKKPKTRRKESKSKKAHRRYDPDGGTCPGIESVVHPNTPQRSEHSTGGDTSVAPSEQLTPIPDTDKAISTSLEREKEVDTSRYNTQVNTREEVQPTAPAPIEIEFSKMSHSQFREIFAWKTSTLPSYTGPRVNRSDNRPVSFPKQFRMAELYASGHERALQDHVYELLPSWKKRNDVISIFYFPGRHFFADDQHVVVMGPATQQSTEHGFKLTSRFERIYGQTRPFFYALGPVKNKFCVQRREPGSEGFSGCNH
ncbi:hypothetical protein E1B28_010729 [Marasmius oreades]|uniref:Uncharacterized protein n=1 Tax=Marasmius oreades TaxID=181124 RepID=A0A9P7RT62_9AGAR|nr:uncharacterized protein E1B28_010729 [Marasmius oreades]KAG7089017.1 hypothetical protein E1B28_010729 [Marasmius oreades]